MKVGEKDVRGTTGRQLRAREERLWNEKSTLKEKKLAKNKDSENKGQNQQRKKKV